MLYQIRRTINIEEELTMAEIAVIKDDNSGKIMDHNAEEVLCGYTS